MGFIFPKTITDWVTFTAVLSGSGVSIGNGSILGKKRRVGDSISYSITVLCGTTTSFGSGLLYFLIPDSIDTNKLPYFGAGVEDMPTVGTGRCINSGVTTRLLTVVVNNAVTVQMNYENGGEVSASNPFAFGGGDKVHVEFTVPIQGLTA